MEKHNIVYAYCDQNMGDLINESLAKMSQEEIFQLRCSVEEYLLKEQVEVAKFDLQDFYLEIRNVDEAGHLLYQLI